MTPSDRVRTTLRVTLALVTVTTATLLVFFLRQAYTTDPVVAATGDVVPLTDEVYGLESTIVMPGVEVKVRTGRPVAYVDYHDVDSSYDDGMDESDDDTYTEPPERLVAADDGRLIPITLELAATEIWSFQDGPPPVTVRLRSGQDSITLWSPSTPGDPPMVRAKSYAIAVAGHPELSDLRIEADYEDVIQRLNPATGEIDEGQAQSLFETRTLATGCAGVPSDCTFSAASPDQPLLPSDFSFTASNVSLNPFDPDLGWALDGTVWAATNIHVFGGQAYDASGASFYVPPGDSPTQVQLVGSDGAVIRPTVSPVAEGGEAGRVVFAVPTDVEPATLVLRKRAVPEETDQQMPLRARVPLG